MSDEYSSVPLKEYFERVLQEHEKQLATASSEMERRLAGLNELRADVVKDRQLLMEKSVYEQMHNALTDRVYKLETFQSRLLGFGSAIVVIATIVGAMLGFFIGHK